MVRPWKASSKAMIPDRPGVGARNLHRIFHRFRAGVHEQRLLWKFAGSDFVHPLGKTYVVLVRRDLHAGVEKFIQLIANAQKRPAPADARR